MRNKANLSDAYILCFYIRIFEVDLNENLKEGHSSGWTKDRKQHFLYRLDVESPISVDRNVTETIDSQHFDANSIGYTATWLIFVIGLIGALSLRICCHVLAMLLQGHRPCQ